MIDVALTGQYDVCLFNSAAQVLVVRSGHSNPSDSLCDFYIMMIWIFPRNTVVLRAISKGVCETLAEIL